MVISNFRLGSAELALSGQRGIFVRNYHEVEQKILQRRQRASLVFTVGGPDVAWSYFSKAFFWNSQMFFFFFFYFDKTIIVVVVTCLAFYKSLSGLVVLWGQLSLAYDTEPALTGGKTWAAGSVIALQTPRAIKQTRPAIPDPVTQYLSPSPPLHITLQRLNTLLRLKNASHLGAPQDGDLAVWVITLGQKDPYQSPLAAFDISPPPRHLSFSLKPNISDVIKVLLCPALRTQRGDGRKVGLDAQVTEGAFRECWTASVIGGSW